MLVELGIGDAFAAPYEYVGKQINFVGGYKTHPRHKNPVGNYTDDTQMSLAIAEMMLSDKDWNDENLADAFYDCYARDRRGGYAHRFAAFLEEVKSGKEFLEKIKPDSEKSGSAMRSVPLGLYSDIDEIKRRAIIQARVTHNTEKGLLNSMAVALSTHYYTYNLGPKLDLYYFLEQHGLQEWTKLWDRKVGSAGHDSVCAALTTVLISDNMLDVLKNSVNYTGDVDTVACIAMGIASQCDDIENNLPYHLYSGLENGTYGRDYLIELDNKLKIKFPALKLSIPYENFSSDDNNVEEIELPPITILPVSEDIQDDKDTQGNLFEQ